MLDPGLEGGLEGKTACPSFLGMASMQHLRGIVPSAKNHRQKMPTLHRAATLLSFLEETVMVLSSG